MKTFHAGLQATQADKPFFRASVNTNGEFEILLYEEIGYDWWTGEGVTAKAIRQQLDNAGPFSKIVMRINSPGGDAFEGVAIGNVLKATGKPIKTCVDGIAASAASIVAMAGDEIEIANNGMLMIHNAWSVCMGDGDDMRKMADTLDKISASIAQTYVDKTGKPMDEIIAMMAAETWLSAKDCIEMGFATKISGEDNAPAMAMAKGFKVLNRMKHVPESLKTEESHESALSPEVQAAIDSAVEVALKNRDGGIVKAAATEPVALEAVAPKAEVEEKPVPEVSADMEDACQCACNYCVSGDCANCSNSSCDDKDCEDCPMQAETGNGSNLSLFKAMEWLRNKRRARHGR